MQRMAIVRRRLLFALCAICAPLAAAALAQEGRSPELQAFIDRYRCEIVVRLEQIRAQPGPKDRFIVLSLRRMPDRYVQCLFNSSGEKMLCEAASGYYAQRPGEPRRFAVSPEGLSALQRRGFSMDDRKGNFQREIETKGPADLGAVAELMLIAFHEGYGARVRSKIDFIAPLGPGGKEVGTRCVPTG
jgi:hypothetical protein